MIVIMIDAKNLMDGIDRYRFMTTAILLCFYLFVPLVVTITGVGSASKLNVIDCGGSGLSDKDSDAYIAEMFQLMKLVEFQVAFFFISFAVFILFYVIIIFWEDRRVLVAPS